MGDLLNFYIRPAGGVIADDCRDFFKKSLILYTAAVLIYTSVSYILSGSELTASSPFSSGTAFFVVNSAALLIKQPVHVLFISYGIYLFVKYLVRAEIKFTFFYRAVFVAFNAVIAAYFLDTANVLTGSYFSFHVADIFRYSLNDIITKGVNCTQLISSFLERINLLLIISMVYLYYLLPCKVCSSRGKLIFMITFPVLIILFLFSAIPSFFLSIMQLAG